MIDKYFLESAQIIRDRYFENQEKLDEYVVIIKKLHDDLMESSQNLYKMVERHKATSDKNELLNVGEEFVKQMNILEERIKQNEKERDVFEGIFIQLDQESNVLWAKIKEKYPTITDAELGKYFSDNLV